MQHLKFASQNTVPGLAVRMRFYGDKSVCRSAVHFLYYINSSQDDDYDAVVHESLFCCGAVHRMKYLLPDTVALRVGFGHTGYCVVSCS